MILIYLPSVLFEQQIIKEKAKWSTKQALSMYKLWASYK